MPLPLTVIESDATRADEVLGHAERARGFLTQALDEIRAVKHLASDNRATAAMTAEEEINAALHDEVLGWLLPRCQEAANEAHAQVDIACGVGMRRIA